MTPITSGPKLVKALHESGTGQDKLDYLGAVLQERYNDTRHVATAEELIEAFERDDRAHGVWAGTLAKMKSFFRHGTAVPPEKAKLVPIWERLDQLPTKEEFDSAIAADLAEDDATTAEPDTALHVEGGQVTDQAAASEATGTDPAPTTIPTE